jgi:hypothetical protein
MLKGANHIDWGSGESHCFDSDIGAGTIYHEVCVCVCLL